MTRRAYIESVSDFCLPNLFDEERIRGYLAKNGFAIVERCEEADLVVVNTCAFVEERQAASLQRIHELESRKRPGARLVVTGCLPEIDPESLGPSFDGVAVGARDLDRLDSVIGAEAPFEEAAETHILPTESRPLAGWRIRLRWAIRSAVLGLGKVVRVEPLASILECNTHPGWFYVRVGEGCRGTCTYCGIRRAKGGLASRPAARILEECAEGVRRGFREILLYGDDVGCWGEDLGTNVVELLDTLTRAHPEVRIHLYYFHPKWWVERFATLSPVLARARFGLVNIPVQSGNDRILGAMGREHAIGPVLASLEEARRLNRRIVFKTQLMVGFPGEGEGEFRDTLRIAGAFDIASVFPFSAREGTAASRLAGRLSKAEISRRGRRLERAVLLSVLRKTRLAPPARS